MNDNPLIGLQTVWTVIADFTDEMKGLAFSIGGDMDIDGGLLSIVDDELGHSYLRLLPPAESDSVAVGIVASFALMMEGVCGGFTSQRNVHR